MLGLVLKDFYEMLCIKKNLLGMIFGYSAILLISLMGRGNYTLILIVAVTIPFTGSSPLQYSLEQDEISKFDEILLTYPLTKKEILQAKYASCLLYMATGWVLSLLIVLLYVFVYQSCDLTNGMIIWSIGLIASILTLAISAVGFYWLGNKKGTFIYMALLVITAAAYVVAYFKVDFSVLLQINVWVLLLIALVISFCLLGLSYLVVIKLYTRKHS